MIRYLVAGALALVSLVACTPEETSSAAAALCASANLVLPYVEGKAGANAQAKVDKYCTPGTTTYAPGTVAELTKVLNTVMPLVKQNPTALAAYKRSPAHALALKYGWNDL